MLPVAVPTMPEICEVVSGALPPEVPMTRQSMMVTDAVPVVVYSLGHMVQAVVRCEVEVMYWPFAQA